MMSRKLKSKLYSNKKNYTLWVCLCLMFFLSFMGCNDSGETSTVENASAAEESVTDSSSGDSSSGDSSSSDSGSGDSSSGGSSGGSSGNNFVAEDPATYTLTWQSNGIKSLGNTGAIKMAVASGRVMLVTNYGGTIKYVYHDASADGNGDYDSSEWSAVTNVSGVKGTSSAYPNLSMDSNGGAFFWRESDYDFYMRSFSINPYTGALTFPNVGGSNDSNAVDYEEEDGLIRVGTGAHSKTNPVADFSSLYPTSNGVKGVITWEEDDKGVNFAKVDGPTTTDDVVTYSGSNTRDTSSSNVAWGTVPMSGEPTVKIHHNNSSHVMGAYRISYTAGEYSTNIACSADGGENWGDEEISSDGAKTSKPMVIMGDKVFVVWREYEESGGTDSNFSVKAREYTGFSGDWCSGIWGSEKTLSQSSNDIMTREFAAAAGGSAAVVAWLQYNDAESYYSVYANYYKNGSWQTTPTLLETGNGAVNNLRVSMASNGVSTVAWNQYDGPSTGGNADIWMSYYNGTAWQTAQEVSNTASNTGGVAVAMTAYKIYIAWKVSNTGYIRIGNLAED